ncbi:hypothetical protein [Streptomyces mangrovisoli]|uniref:NIF system FeS cluster assembly NifU C-terminal domain-containing protein n=1 Tax=Streptomyces mangrovisoli TaxID=1428628 RepID=A0A1J4NT29_9ACTN|nr:hypothetical protein [Streptomyces mangrovisoli]OIJ65258.1 hypothetical protein WN71_024520 [Streptomyces mangrovisoli]
MSVPTTAPTQAAAVRVEEVLDRLAAGGDPAATAAAEELVRSLMEFYGAGLARVVELLPAGAGRDALLGDQLVASLLVLHDLHPEDRATRIDRALATVRDQHLEAVGFDEATGTLRLRAAEGASGEAGGGCGCGSAADAVRQTALDALGCFAPEVTAVELDAADRPRRPALLQIGSRPGARP